MSKQAFIDFKKFWLSNYIKQYKEGDRKLRKELRNNIYRNINLTEDEKDKLWEEIVNRGLENDDK